MESIYFAALAALLGVSGASAAYQMAAACGSAREAFLAGPERLASLPFLGDKMAARIRSRYREELPEQIDDYCRTHGTTVFSRHDSGYPAILKEISDPPAVLYVKGTLPSMANSLAIVGSRKATAYGISTAERFSRQLAGEGMVIVSGGAYGIDAASHEGTLAAKGTTIAVLGSGFEHLYPARHASLFNRICEKGALVSELPPWAPPMAFQFPLRNRIIVGLSRGVLVVEAALKSGAMITARTAADENRDVYAIPGPIYSETSQGTHQLIKEGARLVDSAEEILEEFFPDSSGGKAKGLQPSLFEGIPLEERSRCEAVYQFISEAGGRLPDEIMEHFPWPFPVITMLLLRMEVAGMIRKGAGNRYIIV
jgi:DNA processing protein